MRVVPGGRGLFALGMGMLFPCLQFFVGLFSGSIDVFCYKFCLEMM